MGMELLDIDKWASYRKPTALEYRGILKEFKRQSERNLSTINLYILCLIMISGGMVVLAVAMHSILCFILISVPLLVMARSFEYKFSKQKILYKVETKDFEVTTCLAWEVNIELLDKLYGKVKIYNELKEYCDDYFYISTEVAKQCGRDKNFELILLRIDG